MKARILIIGLGLLLSLFFFGKWKGNITHGGDAWGYYVYLPALLIHQDLPQLTEAIRIREALHPGSTQLDSLGIRRVTEAPALGENNVIKYTYGVALVHLPAFLVTHGIGKLTEAFETHGFSTPYLLAIYLSTLLYVLLGLGLLAKLLLRFFPPRPVWITLFILAFGTNLFYFSTINNGMAHPILFFLWSLLLFQTDTYYRQPGIGRFFFLGGIVGLITVIRPVEAISVLLPLFWGVTSTRTLQERVTHFFRHWQHLLVAAVAGVLFLLPQLLYWKTTTDQWLYYSYPGEGFDFTAPKIWSGLFGFLNGWLIYTPVMILALIGLGKLSWRGAHPGRILLAVVVLHIYIAYSWWNWYYINGFGSRPMVDIYPVLALPFCYFLSELKQTIWKRVVATFLVLGILLNIFQTWQQWKGILWSEAANKAYYTQIFGKTAFNQRISIALDCKRYQPAEMEAGPLLLEDDFEAPGWYNRSTTQASSGTYSARVSNELAGPITYWEIPSTIIADHLQEYNYLQLNCQVFLQQHVANFFEFDGLIIEYAREGETFGSRRIRLNNKAGLPDQLSIWGGQKGNWYPLEAVLPVDFRYREGDAIRVRFEHFTNNSVVFVDDLQLRVAKH